jgi:hypothetical protein
MEQFVNERQPAGEPGFCEYKRMEEYEERDTDTHTYIEE